MGILAINVNTTGLVGQTVNPRRCTLITTDSLATITTAGYLNGQNSSGNQILPTDIFDVLYLFNANTQVGVYGVFQVTYAAATGFSLNAWENPGNVLLPVVSNDFANFNGTSGQIKDSGYSPTNAAKTKVVMLNAAPTINHVAIFTAADGTIGDGGVLGTAAAKAASNNALSTLASTAGSGFTIGHIVIAADAAGSLSDGGVLGTAAAKAASNNALSTLASTAGSGFTIGHLVTAADTLGSLSDSGIVASSLQVAANIKAATTANIGGGGAGPISVAVAGLTTASVVVATIEASSNPASVIACTATGTGFDVTFSADPGATCTLNYVAFIAAQ